MGVGDAGLSLTQMVKCRKENWWFIFLLPEKLLSSFVGKITWLFSLVFWFCVEKN